MYGTIISLIIAGFLIFIPPGKEEALSPEAIAIALFFASILFVLGTVLVYVMSLSPLQKLEQNLAPRLLELFKKDRSVHYITLWLFIFPVFSLLAGAELAFFQYLRPLIVLGIWTLFLGISIDALYHLLQRVISYLNPFALVKHFIEEAKSAVQEEEEESLYHSIDALTEVAIKSIERTIPSLTKETIDGLRETLLLYLDSAKSISHHLLENGEGTDKISYTLFYLFQNLELIQEKALEKRLEPICSHLITALGYISIGAAKLDISLTSFPIHYIGKFVDRSTKKEMYDVSEKATCTLIEVGRLILEEIDVTYLELKDPFFSITQHMEQIAKDTFSRDKSINITLLIQPFEGLKELFTKGKLPEHQDTPVILADIDRVINQFEQLEQVMRTIPAVQLPEEKEET